MIKLVRGDNAASRLRKHGLFVCDAIPKRIISASPANDMPGFVRHISCNRHPLDCIAPNERDGVLDFLRGNYMDKEMLLAHVNCQNGGVLISKPFCGAVFTVPVTDIRAFSDESEIERRKIRVLSPSAGDGRETAGPETAPVDNLVEAAEMIDECVCRGYVKRGKGCPVKIDTYVIGMIEYINQHVGGVFSSAMLSFSAMEKDEYIVMDCDSFDLFFVVLAALFSRVCMGSPMMRIIKEVDQCHISIYSELAKPFASMIGGDICALAKAECSNENDIGMLARICSILSSYYGFDLSCTVTLTGNIRRAVFCYRIPSFEETFFGMKNPDRPLRV